MWKGDNVRPARRLAERISVIAAILANTGAGTRDWGSSVSSSLHLAPPVTFLNHMNYFQHTTEQKTALNVRIAELKKSFPVLPHNL